MQMNKVTVAVNAVVGIKQKLDNVSTALAVTPVGHQGTSGASKVETPQVVSWFFDEDDFSMGKSAISGDGLQLDNGVVMWCDTFEYLGIHFRCGKRLRVDIYPILCCK